MQLDLSDTEKMLVLKLLDMMTIKATDAEAVTISTTAQSLLKKLTVVETSSENMMEVS